MAAATDDSGQTAEKDVGESPIRGRIECLTRRRARGWAINSENPQQTVWVEALVGGRVVGHGIAHLERPDLQDWNAGTTRCGFDFQFYEPLLGDEPPQFRLLAGNERWVTDGQRLPLIDRKPLATTSSAEMVLAEHARFTAPGPHFEEFDWNILSDKERLKAGPEPLILAFYLPQFHAIPQNDEFWGKGFTEWRQVSRALPRFPGHYQPHIPRDLGFYDLLDERAIRRQATMGKAAGVGAFGFYYYRFDDDRVLDRPIEIYLASDIEMPFLIIWANENWTRTWDGGDQQILLKQTYDRSKEDALLADLARHMLDPRYVCLEGRPLFVIYNPVPIPDTGETIARWRRKWREDFGLEPLIFMAQTFNGEDPRAYGLDGALEFPPHKLAKRALSREVLDAFESQFSGHVTDYDEFVRVSLNEPQPAFPLVKTVVPSWDNEPRWPGRGFTLEGSTPQKYQAWLQALVERAIDTPIGRHALVGINAWNEWAEGAHLEPDVHFGAAYLNATARALKAAVAVKNAQQMVVAPAIGRWRARRQVFVHAGQHKTGTTSIQVALTRKREELATAGVLYPRAGCPAAFPYGQHELAWSLLQEGGSGDRPITGRALDDPAAIWESLRAEIARSGADTVVLSSEDFDTLQRPAIEELARRLDGWELSPVLFLRGHSNRMESLYRTSVVYLGYVGGIAEFVREHPTRCDLFDQVQDWQLAAGTSELAVFSYEDPDIRRDVLGVFFRAVGLEGLVGDVHSQPRLNRSEPAFITEAIRHLRRLGVDEAEISAWCGAMRLARLPTDASRRYTCMPAELEAALDAAYDREIERLLGEPATARLIRGRLHPEPRDRPPMVNGIAEALLALGQELRRREGLLG